MHYKMHTDAIKENLISNDLTNKEIAITYANEADVLNMALFGKTAKEWRNENSDLKGNVRDYATIEQGTRKLGEDGTSDANLWSKKLG